MKSGKHPDILHIHNWETAIVAPLFWDISVHQVGILCLFLHFANRLLDSVVGLNHVLHLLVYFIRSYVELEVCALQHFILDGNDRTVHCTHKALL